MMHRRSPSSGSLAVDGVPDIFGRLPPRSPLSSAVGQRTPPNCPTSPLVGAIAWTASGAVSPAPASTSSHCTGNIPSRPRASGISCHAIPPIDLGHSQVLSNIMTSVYESNITAEQCFSTYGRMHAAPPLVGMSHTAGAAGQTHSTSVSSVSAGIFQSPTRPAHTSIGLSLGSHLGTHLLNDINDVDFGLATCLATPMDPGPGLERRLVHQLPTTAAARSAAYKLTSANDILQETSRYGDWVRRQTRRRKLERMQRLLAELGANSLLGKLVDDTLLENDSLTRRRLNWGQDLVKDRGGSRISSGNLDQEVDDSSADQKLSRREAVVGADTRPGMVLETVRDTDTDEFPVQYATFRDDMALER